MWKTPRPHTNHSSRTSRHTRRLAWREAQDRHEDTIIHSDSMAAIKILAQTKTRTYPEITTKIINSALSQRGSLTTLHWVPSHTNIEGNERADALANEATNLTNILHTEQTPDAYKHMITEYLHKQITPNQDTANLSTCVTRAEYQAVVSIGVIDWECRGYGPANPLLINETNSRMSVFMQLILAISMLRIAMTSLRWQIRPCPVPVDDRLVTHTLVEESSSRSKPTLLDSAGYQYTRKVDKRRPGVTWLCHVQGTKTMTCKATVIEKDGRPHVAEVRRQIKAQATKRVLASAAEIVEEANRKRRKVRPQDPADANFDVDLDHIADGFLQHDTMVSNARHLIFATMAMLTQSKNVICRKLTALPLLPQEHITTVFEAIVRQAGVCVSAINNLIEGKRCKNTYYITRSYYTKLPFYLLIRLLHKEARIVNIQVAIVYWEDLTLDQRHGVANITTRLEKLRAEYSDRSRSASSPIAAGSHLIGPKGDITD
ncbi:hypothetical protein LSH36_666g00024 [Paralvinella palmiformis]|uniref:RNase H type-1 domain-containing protein n=1 Tax=Paralvinella palmiformis TaxID=53620 RepID=A0AAD9J3G8_9ANNE|nr:hypothetical protein LSH36_666g00024 [Paralvinella palmiformis]